MPSPQPPRVKLLLLDVDGILTDGSIHLDAQGNESKRFHVRDGLGIKAAMRSGLLVGLLTARRSEATTARARELGIDLVIQGSSDKHNALDDICRRERVALSEIAYMGDDLADLAVMRAVGYPMTVADAVDEIRQVARYITTRPGGHGAVREAIEHLLRETGQWEAVVQRYMRD